jgi:hypothetical protein
MRFQFNHMKGEKLRKNQSEAQEIFSHPYYQDQRSDISEQYRVIGWVGQRIYSLFFEVREDDKSEFCHLVTSWKATKQAIWFAFRLVSI